MGFEHKNLAHNPCCHLQHMRQACHTPNAGRAGTATNNNPVGDDGHMLSVVKQICRILLWLSFTGWLGGHVYSFLGTWSKYQLQYSRKYVPYIESNCGDSKFHQVTMGLNHCDAFLEAIAIPAWERALFEEIQKLPVCSDGKCDSVVSGITNNKTWICVYFAVFLISSLAMLRIKWYLEKQIRRNLPLDNPAAYIENTVHAPSYVDQDGRSWAVQVNSGLRRRINAATIDNGGASLGADEYNETNAVSMVTPCGRYTDVTL